MIQDIYNVSSLVIKMRLIIKWTKQQQNVDFPTLIVNSKINKWKTISTVEAYIFFGLKLRCF